MMPEASAEERVGCALGSRVTSCSPLAGGCIARVSRAELSGGERVVVKRAPVVPSGRGGGGPVGGPAPSLADEAWMLRWLSERTALPVPAVLHSEVDLLVLEWVEHDATGGAGAQADMAEHLAALHGIGADAVDGGDARRFGFGRRTPLATLWQDNAWSSSWASFWRDRRLMPMARLARRSGGIDDALLARVDRLAERTERWIVEPERGSVVHGDAWSGNVLTRGGRVAAFVDPAVHVAAAESELAFGTLFGPFGPAFFERYAELRPIAEGFFERRRAMYNVVPMLVHAHLFGGGYAGSVSSLLASLGL